MKQTSVHKSVMIDSVVCGWRRPVWHDVSIMFFHGVFPRCTGFSNWSASERGDNQSTHSIDQTVYRLYERTVGTILSSGKKAKLCLRSCMRCASSHANTPMRGSRDHANLWSFQLQHNESIFLWYLSCSSGRSSSFYPAPFVLNSIPWLWLEQSRVILRTFSLNFLAPFNF